MIPLPRDPFYCSDLSRQAGEPLIGSATPTIHYLLIEYNGPWGTKALEESDLPEAVKKHAGAFVKASRSAKTLLIHRPEDREVEKLHVFLAQVAEGARAIYAFELDRYEQLLDLDFAGVLADPGRYRAYRREEPLLLVCANGRRDLCCARRGPKVYDFLDKAAAASPVPIVWQSTHLGGHRFAANLIALPQGLLYGRVDDDCAQEILEATLKGQVYLSNLRGRTAYPPPAQAADQFLRLRTGRTALDDYGLVEMQELGDVEWMVAFREQISGRIHRLNVRVEQTGEEVYDGCKLDKLVSVRRYAIHLIDPERSPL